MLIPFSWAEVALTYQSMKKSEWVGRLYFRTPRCVGNSHKRCGLVNFGRANDQWRCVSVKRLGHDWICATKIRCLSCLIGSGCRVFAGIILEG